MFRYDDFSEELITYFREEALPKNYPDFLIRQDLTKLTYNYLKAVETYYQDELESTSTSYDDGYEEGKEEGYEDGHYDGEREGRHEAKEEFIRELAARILRLKKHILDNDIEKKELQLKLTELLIKMNDLDIYCGDEEFEDIDSAYEE